MSPSNEVIPGSYQVEVTLVNQMTKLHRKYFLDVIVLKNEENSTNEIIDGQGGRTNPFPNETINNDDYEDTDS